MYIYIYIYVFMCIYTYIYIFICIYIHVYSSPLHVRVVAKENAVALIQSKLRKKAAQKEINQAKEDARSEAEFQGKVIYI